MFSLAPHLRVVADQDGAVVLDIKRNATFSLNPTTAYVWQKLAHRVPVEQIVEELSKETKQNPATVENDVREFLEELRQNELVVEGCPAFQMKRTVIKALCLLFLYELLVPPVKILRRGSLAYIRSAVRRWSVAPIPVDPARSAEVCDAVEKACMWYPKKVLCLQRSVVTTYLLRNAGIDASFVIGAQKMPFKAHAWVEVAGKVVNDRPDAVARFIVFERS